MMFLRVCRTCNGERRIVVDEETAWALNVDRIVKCPKCAGSGLMPSREAVTVEPPRR